MKALALIVVLSLTFSSVLAVNSVIAQSTPQPVEPEFKLKFVNSSIEIKIKNQALTPYEKPQGIQPNLYYLFRVKNN